MGKKKLSEYRLNDSNPRFISQDKLERLKKSIQDFPQMMSVRPIVVDDENVVLGGNMRFRALQELGYTEVDSEWIKQINELTDEQKQEFIIKDNVGFGSWDWEVLASEWDNGLLCEWGLDVIGFDVNPDEYGEDFSLPDGDKAPFQQMTFTLADEQAEQVKNAIADIKQTEEYKYCETMGNENSNGNALYLIIMQWAEQRK